MDPCNQAASAREVTARRVEHTSVSAAISVRACENFGAEWQVCVVEGTGELTEPMGRTVATQVPVQPYDAFSSAGVVVLSAVPRIRKKCGSSRWYFVGTRTRQGALA